MQDLSKRTTRTQPARAQRGASLPFALLLFLICGLLASVVLAASTGASGRHSQLSDMDQRYYSVVSAAGLVRDEFANQEVTLECVQEKDVTTMVTYHADGTVTRGSSTENVKGVTVKVDGTTVASGTGASTISKSDFTLPELSALYLLAGQKTSTIDPLRAWDLSSLDTDTEFEVGSYSLTPTVASAPTGVNKASLQNGLAVSVTEWALEGAALRFQLDSAAPASDDIYSLTLDCTADIDFDESSEETREDTPASGGGSTFTRAETSSVTTTRTIIVSWTPSELYKTGSGEGVGA